MNILVLGAGAIGLVFGGFLAKAGHRVIFLGREKNILALNHQGIFIEGIWGNHHIIANIKGYTTLGELKEKEASKFDFALLTVKSYDTETLLKEFKSNFNVPLPIISLQNGIGNLETMAEIIGLSWSVGGRVIFGAELIEPAKVKVTVYAEEVVIGGMGNNIEFTKVNNIAKILDSAGIPTLPTDEIEKYIWGKALYNSALNGLGAILGVKYGFLKEHDYSRWLITRIVEEFFLVAEKENKKLHWANPKEYLADLFERLIPITYDHYPSMFRDIQNQKRTEIDYLNGAIVSRALKHRIEVPVNWLITNLVKVKEKMSRGIQNYG